MWMSVCEGEVRGPEVMRKVRGMEVVLGEGRRESRGGGMRESPLPFLSWSKTICPDHSLGVRTGRWILMGDYSIS